MAWMFSTAAFKSWGELMAAEDEDDAVGEDWGSEVEFEAAWVLGAWMESWGDDDEDVVPAAAAVNGELIWAMLSRKGGETENENT
jgi:hypothetical protein